MPATPQRKRKAGRTAEPRSCRPRACAWTGFRRWCLRTRSLKGRPSIAAGETLTVWRRLPEPGVAAQNRDAASQPSAWVAAPASWPKSSLPVLRKASRDRRQVGTTAWGLGPAPLGVSASAQPARAGLTGCRLSVTSSKPNGTGCGATAWHAASVASHRGPLRTSAPALACAGTEPAASERSTPVRPCGANGRAEAETPTVRAGPGGALGGRKRPVKRGVGMSVQMVADPDQALGLAVARMIRGPAPDAPSPRPCAGR